MPVYEVELADGRTFEVEADTPPSEADVLAAIGSQTAEPSAPAGPQEQGTTGAPETITGVRHGAPATIRTTGRFVANHPSGVQKTIGAGMTALSGTIGAGLGSMVGGPTGAVVGALAGGSVRGLTPTQQTIREMSGRMAGEAPHVAKEAGRAVGIQEYIKNTSGLKVKPSDILERPHGLPAAESYAKSQGRDILKILGPDGNVAVGPTTPSTPAKPRVGGRLLTKAARGAGAVGRGLAAVSGPMGITDLAQTIEPTRQDIGVMGIGKSVNVPGMHPTALEQLRQAILQRLGY